MKNQIKILHTADTQLGFAQYGLDKRLEDFNRSAYGAIISARDHEADFVIVAGDLFEMDRPPASAILAMQAAVSECNRAGIQVCGVPGNHDAGDTEDGGGLLAVCGVYNLERPMTHTTSDTRVGGLGYRDPDVFYDELKTYLGAVAPLDVLVLHQGLSEFIGFDLPLTAVEVSQIIKSSPSAATCRLVALGDLHVTETQVIDGITFTYPGSTEWNSRTEAPHKSVNLITMTPTDVDVRCEPIETRQIAPVMISEPDDLMKLRHRLQQPNAANVLYSVIYNKDIPEVRQELSKILKGRLFRIVPEQQEKGLTAEILSGQHERENTKVGARQALRDVLESSFPTGDIRARLIVALLDNPQDVDTTVEQFVMAMQKQAEKTKENDDERKNETTA